MTKTISFIILFSAFIYFPSTAQAQHRTVMVFSTSGTVEKAKNALEDGEIDKAIFFYNNAIRLGLSDLEFYTANNDLCVAYYLKEAFNDAMKNCDIAIKTISNKWVAYNNRGNIHLETGRYLLAIKDYEKGLSLKKSSEILKTNLEIALSRKSYIDENGRPEINPKKPDPFVKNKSSATVLGFR